MEILALCGVIGEFCGEGGSANVYVFLLKALPLMYITLNFADIFMNQIVMHK